MFIKVKYSTNATRGEEMVDSAMSIIDFLNDHAISAGRGAIVSLNGMPLTADEMQNAFEEIADFTQRDSCILTATVKADSAAHIKVCGEAMYIVSDIKAEDMRNLANYAPEKLVLKDEEKKPVFRMEYADPLTKGSVSNYGIVFDDTDEEGHAALTVYPVEKDKVAQEYAKQFLNIKKLEEQVKAGLADLAKDIEAVKAMIS